MEATKIQLSHPEGKKAPAISLEKYEVLQQAIMTILKKEKQLTHTELASAINEYLEKKKIAFEGSANWFGEWVKLDMLANKLLTTHTENNKRLISLTAHKN